jgi:hypothetical protein
MSGEQQPIFTSEERRFLFELSLLGLTGGCKLEGFVFALALDTLDSDQPYSRIAKALAMLHFDQFEDADAILASPVVANSDLGDYALSIRGLIAKARGEGRRASELGKALEEEGSTPSLLAMAKLLAGA